MKKEITFNKVVGDDGHLVSPVLKNGAKNYLIDIFSSFKLDVRIIRMRMIYH